jgi:hypothetical protein
MARERFLDDELAAEIAAREAFDAVETVALAAVEEQDHVADEPPDGGNEVNNDDLDGDFLAELGNDHEAEEAGAERRALMASFDTKW